MATWLHTRAAAPAPPPARTVTPASAAAAASSAAPLPPPPAGFTASKPGGGPAAGCSALAASIRSPGAGSWQAEEGFTSKQPFEAAFPATAPAAAHRRRRHRPLPALLLLLPRGPAAAGAPRPPRPPSWQASRYPADAGRRQARRRRCSELQRRRRRRRRGGAARAQRASEHRAHTAASARMPCEQAGRSSGCRAGACASPSPSVVCCDPIGCAIRPVADGTPQAAAGEPSEQAGGRARSLSRWDAGRRSRWLADSSGTQESPELCVLRCQRGSARAPGAGWSRMPALTHCVCCASICETGPAAQPCSRPLERAAAPGSPQPRACKAIATCHLKHRIVSIAGGLPQAECSTQRSAHAATAPQPHPLRCPSPRL